MPAPKCSDNEFVTLFETLGPHELARRLDMASTKVLARRRRLEEKMGRPIVSPTPPNSAPRQHHPHRIQLDIQTGTVIIGGDAHYWPGEPSTAHRAFVRFIKDIKPRAVIMNGDAFDGARISRHPPIGWAQTPTVKQEIEVVQDRLQEIADACPRGCRKAWPLGNHDARYETRIATVLPELAEVHGVSLQDHFALWEPCWSVFINDDVVVKHRFKGGVHATYNNTLHAGMTMVTGHLHSQRITPITDYRGTRYGVDAGCLADPDASAFTDYTEDGPKNWRSGFCVLTFKDGKLLMPELVTVWDADHVQFRGELVRV